MSSRTQTKPRLDRLIYVFEKDDVCYAVASVGRELFGAGFKIEPDPTKTQNSRALQERRAKREVINQVTNTLNALSMYGTDLLDEKGDIDPERFQLYERLTALKGTSAAGIAVPLSMLKPIQTFKTAAITFLEAQALGLV